MAPELFATQEVGKKFDPNNTKGFQGWSEDAFKVVNVNAIRALRDFLRENGVFVNKAKSLNMIKSLLQTQINQSTIRQETKTEFPLPGVTMLYKIDNTKFNPDKSLLQSNFTQPYIPQQTGSPQGITNLRKAYHQKLKYSGGDDSLSLKLEIFYDFCAENVMLSGQAHLYYYSKIAKLTLDFNGASQMLRYQYETEQPQQKDFSEWSTITLSGTLNQNSDKSLDQYFELMLDNLQNLQLRLAPIYHTQKALRDKIMYACRSIPEFCLACFSPIPILEGVCNQLRSSILIAIELPRKPFINQKSNLLVYFFTDRRYHGNYSCRYIPHW
ncbi:hypothetical protein HI914_04730 [Erysiphe necator]|nr:hypothetical protein HI914_04730 [Erysiphe necator]